MLYSRTSNPTPFDIKHEPDCLIENIDENIHCLLNYNDLGNALSHIQKKSAKEWRIHFHVPIFVEDYNHIQSTQCDIADALNLQKQRPYTTHLEIETYTWSVLPMASSRTSSPRFGVSMNGSWGSLGSRHWSLTHDN